MTWKPGASLHRQPSKEYQVRIVLESELALIFATELELKPGKNNLLTFLFVCLFLDYSLGGHDLGPHVVAVCQENRAISASGRSLDTSIGHSQKSLRAYSLNAHDKSFRREGFNGKFVQLRFFV